MKKIFTLMAGVAVCAVGYAAAPKLPEPVKVESTVSPEMLQSLRVENARAFNDPATKGDYTRTWTDAQGRVWDLQLNMYDQSLGDFFGLTTQDNKPLTFDDLPYYPARYMLRRFNADQTAIVDGVMFYMAWPTYYIYDQIFTYDGELDSNDNIPVDKRNYEVVPPSELLNNTRGCRTFTERPVSLVGGILNESNTGWSTFGIMNNEWLKISAVYNGAECYTLVDGNTASTLVFSSYDIADNSIGVRNRIFISTANGGRQTIANNYSGTADVEGFEPRYVDNSFGDIHVFNAGLLNSTVLGGNNPFTDNKFGDVTAFYVAASDPVYVWRVDPSATQFSPSVVRLYYANEGNTNISEVQQNLMLGYAFGDASYAKDTSLDPKEMMFKLNEGEIAYEPSLDQYFTKIYPMPNTFVTAGLAVSWSEEFGMEVDNQGSVLVLDGPQEFGWGTKDGFTGSFRSQWSRYVSTKSTGNIIYHYDPKNVQLTRTFSSIGELAPSGVEDVVAEDAQAQVVARNGMISVNAGQKAPIAIFTLDGKLVKAVEAENVAVEAAKGVYVVRVGEKATKVVL